MGMIRNLNFNPVKTTAEKARVMRYGASHSMGADGVETEGKVGGRAREILVGVLRGGLRQEGGRDIQN